MSTAPSPHALRVADLNAKHPTSFDVQPDETALRDIAERLSLTDIRKLSFRGTVSAAGKYDWRLDAQLGATVVQPCAITLAPVSTRIDERVHRLLLKDYNEPEDLEAEMPEDDTTEALGAWIEPWEVMIEALSLALPMYPRAPGAELGEAVFTEPGKAAMTDDDAKPFAGLAGLRDKLGNDG